MILKALKNGVSEERIATALNVNVGSIRKKRDMLDGICPEAIELLRNSHMTADAFAVLRKMKPVRQIEAAEYMGTSLLVSTNTPTPAVSGASISFRRSSTAAYNGWPGPISTA